MDSFILVDQKITDKEKDKNWHKSHIIQFLNFYSKNKNTERTRQQLMCLKAYLCTADKEAQLANRAITAPYGIGLGLQWMDYPSIE